MPILLSRPLALLAALFAAVCVHAAPYIIDVDPEGASLQTFPGGAHVSTWPATLQITVNNTKPAKYEITKVEKVTSSLLTPWSPDPAGATQPILNWKAILLGLPPEQWYGKFDVTFKPIGGGTGGGGGKPPEEFVITALVTGDSDGELLIRPTDDIVCKTQPYVNYEAWVQRGDGTEEPAPCDWFVTDYGTDYSDTPDTTNTSAFPLTVAGNLSPAPGTPPGSQSGIYSIRAILANCPGTKRPKKTTKLEIVDLDKIIVEDQSVAPYSVCCGGSLNLSHTSTGNDLPGALPTWSASDPSVSIIDNGAGGVEAIFPDTLCGQTIDITAEACGTTRTISVEVVSINIGQVPEYACANTDITITASGENADQLTWSLTSNEAGATIVSEKSGRSVTIHTGPTGGPFTLETEASGTACTVTHEITIIKVDFSGPEIVPGQFEADVYPLGGSYAWSISGISGSFTHPSEGKTGLHVDKTVPFDTPGTVSLVYTFDTFSCTKEMDVVNATVTRVLEPSVTVTKTEGPVDALIQADSSSMAGHFRYEETDAMGGGEVIKGLVNTDPSQALFTFAGEVSDPEIAIDYDGDGTDDDVFETTATLSTSAIGFDGAIVGMNNSLKPGNQFVLFADSNNSPQAHFQLTEGKSSAVFDLREDGGGQSFVSLAGGGTTATPPPPEPPVFPPALPPVTTVSLSAARNSGSAPATDDSQVEVNVTEGPYFHLWKLFAEDNNPRMALGVNQLGLITEGSFAEILFTDPDGSMSATAHLGTSPKLVIMGEQTGPDGNSVQLTLSQDGTTGHLKLGETFHPTTSVTISDVEITDNGDVLGTVSLSKDIVKNAEIRLGDDNTRKGSVKLGDDNNFVRIDMNKNSDGLQYESIAQLIHADFGTTTLTATKNGSENTVVGEFKMNRDAITESYVKVGDTGIRNSHLKIAEAGNSFVLDVDRDGNHKAVAKLGEDTSLKYSKNAATGDYQLGGSFKLKEAPFQNSFVTVGLDGEREARVELVKDQTKLLLEMKKVGQNTQLNGSADFTIPNIGVGDFDFAKDATGNAITGKLALDDTATLKNSHLSVGANGPSGRIELQDTPDRKLTLEIEPGGNRYGSITAGLGKLDYRKNGLENKIEGRLELPEGPFQNSWIQVGSDGERAADVRLVDSNGNFLTLQMASTDDFQGAAEFAHPILGLTDLEFNRIAGKNHVSGTFRMDSGIVKNSYVVVGNDGVREGRVELVDTSGNGLTVVVDPYGNHSGSAKLNDTSIDVAPDGTISGGFKLKVGSTTANISVGDADDRQGNVVISNGPNTFDYLASGAEKRLILKIDDGSGNNADLKINDSGKLRGTTTLTIGDSSFTYSHPEGGNASGVAHLDDGTGTTADLTIAADGVVTGTTTPAGGGTVFGITIAGNGTVSGATPVLTAANHTAQLTVTAATATTAAKAELDLKIRPSANVEALVKIDNTGDLTGSARLAVGSSFLGEATFLANDKAKGKVTVTGSTPGNNAVFEIDNNANYTGTLNLKKGLIVGSVTFDNNLDFPAGNLKFGGWAAGTALSELNLESKGAEATLKANYQFPGSAGSSIKGFINTGGDYSVTLKLDDALPVSGNVTIEDDMTIPSGDLTFGAWNNAKIDISSDGTDAVAKVDLEHDAGNGNKIAFSADTTGIYQGTLDLKQSLVEGHIGIDNVRKIHQNSFVKFNVPDWTARVDVENDGETAKATLQRTYASGTVVDFTALSNGTYEGKLKFVSPSVKADLQIDNNMQLPTGEVKFPQWTNADVKINLDGKLAEVNATHEPTAGNKITAKAATDGTYEAQIDLKQGEVEGKAKLLTDLKIENNGYLRYNHLSDWKETQLVIKDEGRSAEVFVKRTFDPNNFVDFQATTTGKFTGEVKMTQDGYEAYAKMEDDRTITGHMDLLPNSTQTTARLDLADGGQLATVTANHDFGQGEAIAFSGKSDGAYKGQIDFDEQNATTGQGSHGQININSTHGVSGFLKQNFKAGPGSFDAHLAIENNGEKAKLELEVDKNDGSNLCDLTLSSDGSVIGTFPIVRNGDITATLSIAKPAGGNLEITGTGKIDLPEGIGNLTLTAGGSSAAIQATVHDPDAPNDRALTLGFDPQGQLINGTGIYRINPGLVANANFAPDRDWDLSVTQSFDAAVLQAIYNTDTNVGTIGFGINDSLLIGSTNVLYNLSTLVDTDGKLDLGASLEAVGDGWGVTTVVDGSDISGEAIFNDGADRKYGISGDTNSGKMSVFLEDKPTPQSTLRAEIVQDSSGLTANANFSYQDGPHFMKAGIKAGPDVNTSAYWKYKLEKDLPTGKITSSLDAQVYSTGDASVGFVLGIPFLSTPDGNGRLDLKAELNDVRDDFNGTETRKSLFLLLTLPFPFF